MPIEPRPEAAPLAPPVPDRFADASFYDVTLGNMVAALLASAAYAPGPLVTQLALAATAEIMYQTHRWNRVPGVNPTLGVVGGGGILTPAEAEELWNTFRIKGG